MNTYQDQSQYPKHNAQRNLSARTHYIDDSSLRFHKSRILSAHTLFDGLMFYIIESCAIDPDNKNRGFRYVIFDIFGSVIGRVNLEDSFKSSDKAKKAMWAFIETIDAKALTLAAIDSQELCATREYKAMREQVQA